MMLFGWSDSFNTRMCLAGANQALKKPGVMKPRDQNIYCEKDRSGNGCFKPVKRVLEDGERPFIIGFGTTL